MNSEKVKQGLRACGDRNCNYEDCPYFTRIDFCDNEKLHRNAVQLIGELEEEIIRLKEIISNQDDLCFTCQGSVKSFAERLKLRIFTDYYKELDPNLTFEEFCQGNIICDEIDEEVLESI